MNAAGSTETNNSSRAAKVFVARMQHSSNIGGCGQGCDCIVHSAHSSRLALVSACDNEIGGGAMYVRACKALMCLVSFGFTDPGTIAQEFVGQSELSSISARKRRIGKALRLLHKIGCSLADEVIE
jgi:hypothetical protein